MLTHVDLVNHTLDFRCEHCYGHHTQLPIHPQHGHVTVRVDDCYVTCPSCRAHAESGTPCPECVGTEGEVHGHTVEIFRFNHLTDVDAGWVESADSLVGTVLEGGNVVVLDDRRGVSNPARQRQARLILALQRHPYVVAAREAATATTNFSAHR